MSLMLMSSILEQCPTNKPLRLYRGTYGGFSHLEDMKQEQEETKNTAVRNIAVRL
ncbi:hypothetical protein PAHAL_1G250600 [Panicum hallii]|uniref:Uncharacterized protein n=1 Tax=Panicum hallii TaxID=206008 RepID=A0A2T8KW96_9POAL|nr:hypothetical protein PAHAL_1G250600 [Panicum hallii]